MSTTARMEGILGDAGFTKGLFSQSLFLSGTRGAIELPVSFASNRQVAYIHMWGKPSERTSFNRTPEEFFDVLGPSMELIGERV